MMNTTAVSPLTALNLAGVAWIEDGKRAAFQSAARSFGIRNAAGEWLSFDGVRPYCVSRKAAVEVASTIIVDDTLHWVRAL